MNKIEYELKKQQIINTFGKPEYDMQQPLNECARQLTALRMAYIQACRAAKQREAKEAGKDVKPETINEIAKSIPKEYVNKYAHISLPELNLKESDLLGFSAKEKEILIEHYQNLNLSHNQLSLRHGTPRQAITALINSPAVKILDAKVFDALLPLESRIALLRCVRGGDSKIVQRVAEHYGVLKAEKMEIDLNKPIDDPAALKMLKELGDKLVDENK